MSQCLENRVVLVTGAGAGIGRATALAFAREGARVVVSDIAIAAGQETVAHIEAAGGAAHFIACDVTQAAQVAALVTGTLAAYGRLDCACNNAGISGPVALTADYPEAAWDETVAINLKGVWLCMKYELQHMLPQSSGAIVNMASVAGLVAERGLIAYAAAKGGVVSLTRTAAIEYARKGIRINAVCPGGIHTAMLDRSMADLVTVMATPVGAAKPPWNARLMAQLVRWRPIRDTLLGWMHPLGRAGQAEEVAAAVVWLCSEQASFITGQTLAIDGGLVAA